MTVNNAANKVVAAGNGVQTLFNFSFIGVAAGDLTVIVTDSSGVETTIAPAQYTLALNPAPAGQIWGIGGTVTYPLVGSPIPTGSTLTIVRELPLTQLVALGNQGNEFPSAVETALDLLMMTLQQVAELFQRAIVAPVVDPSAPLPLPPAAQRANLALIFDASGNPTAGALPASGVISSAMQAVVSAATLAAGRAAFGLGAMATEGIGAGLADDGAGNARVISPITSVSSNQSVTTAFHLQRYLASGPINFVCPRANTLFNGFGFWLYNNNAGAVTVVIDANDTVQGYSSGQSVNIPPDTVVFISTDAANAGTWLLQLGTLVAAPFAPGGFANLLIKNNAGTPNSQIDVTADELVIPSLLGGAVRKTGVAFTINCATVGANGMDVGSLPTSGFIYVWAISDGKNVAGLASLSSTAPTMPSGYSYRKRLGAMPTDGSAALKRIWQVGNRANYRVTTGSNTTTPPVMISGAQSFWTAVATGGFVPPTAAQIKVILSASLTQNSSTYVAVAPNNNYPTTAKSGSSPIAFGADLNNNVPAFCNQLAELDLESSNIYYGASGTFGAVALSCYGWTDSI